MSIDTGNRSKIDILERLPFPALVIDASSDPVWWNRSWDQMSSQAGGESEAALKEVIQLAVHSIRSVPGASKQYTTIPDEITSRLTGPFDSVFVARVGEYRSGEDHFYISLMDLPRMDDSFWRVWEAMTGVAKEERLFTMFYWQVYRHEDGRLCYFASDYRSNGGFEMDCYLDDLPARFDFVNYDEYRQYLDGLIAGESLEQSRIVAHARTPLGRDRFFETIGKSIPNDPRLLASGLAIDVTAMVMAWQAEEQTARLKAARFAMTGITHALNNMLTSCYASVEMLGYEIPEDEENAQRKELKRLAADLDRGHKISQALMKLGAMASEPPTNGDQKPPALQSQGVTAHAIRRMVDSVRAICRRVEFTSDIRADGFPVLRDVDEERLAGAAINLTLNSLKAISQKAKLAGPGFKGRVHMGIEAHAARPVDWLLDDDNENPCKYGCLQIIIEDNGVGMSDATLKRCTEPFFTTDDENSSGLGLSESLAMAMAIKGSLRVKSEEGRGTQVMIFLPAPEPCEA